MMNYKELKRKEFLFEIIDDVIDNMDIYNYNGSLWLIKTEELKWAIEFTKDKTLWYSYILFKSLLTGLFLVCSALHELYIVISFAEVPCKTHS